MTHIGFKCLERDMEIRNNLLVEVGARLDVEVYARIASAYIAAAIDLFSNPHQELQQHTGLTDEHLALASQHGDIHTAVKWYLKWLPELSLPAVHEGRFNSLCFPKMHSYLKGSCDEFVFDPDKTGWESRLSVAIAFAFQKNIVCRHGNTCVTCFINEDAKRVGADPPLACLNVEVEISQRSVCYSDKVPDSNSSSWLVYVKTARFPHVTGLTVLTTNIAAWFSHFRFRQENEFDYAMAVRSLLFDPHRSAALSEFASLLASYDDEVELDMPTDEGNVHKRHRAATTSYDEAPRLTCPHELLIRVRTILNLSLIHI